MVTCKICKKNYKKITNSHLRDKHQIDIQEYLRLFPNSIMTSKEVIKSISLSTKGRSYQERYGIKKAEELKAKRSKDAKKQFKNLEQRIVRRHKNWKGYKDISGDYWTHLCKAAKKKNKGFDLTIEFIWELFEKQNGQCAISKLPIYLDTKLGSLNKNGYQRRTASLDRIDSSRGYTKDNVQWLHKEINQMKSCRNQKDFIFYCKAVALNNN